MALSPLVMGIVNVTPDSFFAGARTQGSESAIARGRELFEVGCDVVDVGGESTRPGAIRVDDDEEIARVVPVIRELATLGPVSIDTRKEAVARAGVAAGASVLNDVSASLLELASELRVGYVAMHAKGTPETMQLSPTYDDVVGEVEAFLTDVARRAQSLGVSPMWIDPGIGFGKTVEHNLLLLAHVDRFVALGQCYGAGVVIGTSRKRFLGRLGVQELEVDERLEGSIASEAWALVHGVSMVRVHDAVAAVQLRELLERRVEEVVA